MRLWANSKTINELKNLPESKDPHRVGHLAQLYGIDIMLDETTPDRMLESDADRQKRRTEAGIWSIE